MKKNTLKISLVFTVALFILLGFKIDYSSKLYLKNLENNLMKVESYHGKRNKNAKEVNKNPYACNHEVTNYEYRLFLTYLKTTKQDSLYKKCFMDTTMWVKDFPYSFNEPMMKMYGWHPAYNDYPAVGMKYEGAVEYCKWLTKVYNEFAERKFKKVIFRLPTEWEWMESAKGMPDMILPWYGAYAYDSKGKYYCNIKCGMGNYTDDGGAQTLVNGHYQPNKIGLYDVIGNVAEMAISWDKNKKDSVVIKGGSWADEIQDCYITKRQSYKAPGCRVGFRVYMEIVEEKK
jgi:formylglycine-generating enzyme required for sulfatase activity